VIDVVLVNSNPASAAAVTSAEEPIDPVLPDSLDELGGSFRVVARDVVSDRNPLRHDPDKLTAVLLEIAREAAADRALGRN
jgi:hypothetical protein